MGLEEGAGGRCTSARCRRSVAALTSLSSQIEEMAVEAALTGDPRLVYYAIANDPLTAAVLSLAEIREMTDKMLEKNRDYLPQFKKFKS